MPSIRIFDPPMCCSTGVCGPEADDEPAQFAAAISWAQKNGASVDRFNLAQQPGAFAEETSVKQMIETDGVDCLPLVFVDGEILTKGGYPSRAVLAEKLGLDATESAPADVPACCGTEEEASAPSKCC